MLRGSETTLRGIEASLSVALPPPGDLPDLAGYRALDYECLGDVVSLSHEYEHPAIGGAGLLLAVLRAPVSARSRETLAGGGLAFRLSHRGVGSSPKRKTTHYFVASPIDGRHFAAWASYLVDRCVPLALAVGSLRKDEEYV